MPVGMALAVLTLILAAKDWRGLISQGIPEITRTVDEKLSLGAENLVTLRIRNSSFTRLEGAVRDEYRLDQDSQDHLGTGCSAGLAIRSR